MPGLLEGLGATIDLWAVTRASGTDVTSIRFVQVSPGFLALLGYSYEELTSRPYLDFVHGEDAERLREISKAVRQHDSLMKVTVRYRTASGSPVWLAFHSRMRGEYVFSNIRDVTELRMAIARERIAKACLKELASKDGLTGLFNRRTFDEVAVRELTHARRHFRPVSLIALDVDHFKKVNDSFGHEVGDEVLQAMGNILRHSVRACDFVFRPGGEEFAVLLPECSLDDALVVAEKILAAVRACDTVAGVRFTASAGVSCYPDSGLEWPGVARAADAALYRAKGEGRDRVVSAGPEP